MNDDIDVEEPHENWLLRHSFLASCLFVIPAALITFIPAGDTKDTKTITQSSAPPALIAGYNPK